MLLVVAVAYVLPLVRVDPSLVWASGDEVCCHVPAIRAIQREGLRHALTDYRYYRSATTPLYHLLMSLAIDRVDPLAIRAVWIVTTFAVAILLYRHIRSDPELAHGGRAGAALALAFLLSPTTRASAVYFVTDGLALDLAIAALALLRRARTGAAFSPPFAALAIVTAFASFYTRQYYVWVPLYVLWRVLADSAAWRRRIVTLGGCALLGLPGLALFVAWRGATPPLGMPVHTHPALLSTLPNALGLLALYSAPLMWIAVRDGGSHGTTGSRFRASVVLCFGLAAFVLAGLALGFSVPQAGGVLRVVNALGPVGPPVFLTVSYFGLVMLVRWYVVDGPWQLWWAAFLLPLLTGGVLLQRYFEPAVMVFLFLVARPRDALQALDSRLVWFYPGFTAAYALFRIVYYA
jgi:hypothetical protein